MNRNQYELYHHGVKGMKWGVRRNSRVLANNRRNKAVRDIKRSYRSGEISKKQERASIKQANATKKETQKRLVKETNTREQRKALKDQVRREVPNAGLKKGLTTLNKGVAVASISSGIIEAGINSMVFPQLAPAYIGVLAGGTAVSAGRAYLVQRGILDKLA